MNAIVRKAKRVISMILALSMVMSLLPMTVFAVEPDNNLLQMYVQIVDEKDSYTAGEEIEARVFFNNPVDQEGTSRYNVGMLVSAVKFDNSKLEIVEENDAKLVLASQIKVGEHRGEPVYADTLAHVQKGEDIAYLAFSVEPQYNIPTSQVGRIYFTVKENCTTPTLTFDANETTLFKSLPKGTTIEQAIQEFKNDKYVPSVDENVCNFTWVSPNATYTVSFETNADGVTVDPMSGISSGDTITRPTDPTRNGYYLEGWYKDNNTFENKWNFESDKVTGDMSLYARWLEKIEKPTYTKTEYEYTGEDITLELTGYTDIESKVNTTGALTANEVGNKAFKLTPKTGYVWSGDNSVDQYVINWKIVKAKLTKPTVTSETEFTFDNTRKEITIDGLDGNKMTVTGDQFATEVGNYTATVSIQDTNNYEWTDGTTTPVVFNWKIEAAPTFTVTFMNLGEVYASGEVISGETIEAPATDPTALEGMFFAHWCSDEELTQEFDFSTPITKDTTLYATYTCNYGKYTYDVNDLINSTTACGIISEAGKPDTEGNSAGLAYLNDQRTLTATAKDGYHFVEWRVYKGWSGTLSSLPTYSTDATISITIEGPTQAFAIFEEDAPEVYTITVTNGTANKESGESGDVITITANDPETGKEFDRWVVNAGGVTLADEEAEETTFTIKGADVEVEATYKDVENPVESDKVEPTESDTTEPTESDKVEPTESDTTEPTESDKVEPIESDTTEPTESDKVEPTESDKVEPTESDTTEPTESDKVEPTESDTTEPAESDKVEPTESDTTEPIESDKVEPTESDTTEPTESDTTEPTESDKVEPTESDTTEPAESDKVEPTESDTTEPTESDKVEPTESDTTEPTESDKVEPTESDTTEPTESDKVEPTESDKVEPTESDTTEPTESDKVEPTESDTTDPEPEEPTTPDKPTNNARSSGGGTAVTYKVTTTASEGGKITPANFKVGKGQNKKFTMTPYDGYEVEDVMVDGKSVGAVKEYTLENVREEHTIEVSFKKTAKQTSTVTPVADDWNNPFTDVKPSDWFYDYVKYVVNRGLFNGTSANTFEPNTSITRGMLVTVLYRHAGAVETDKSTFDDVDPNMYYSAPIAWAAKNGFVNGVGDNKFNPDANITRQDLATIIYRYLKANGEGFTGMWSFLLEFADRDLIAEYAYEPVCYLSMNKIVNGKDNNMFDPLGRATRAEVAAIMRRLAK